MSQDRLNNLAVCKKCMHETNFRNFLPDGFLYKNLSKKTKIICPNCNEELRVGASKNINLWVLALFVSALFATASYFLGSIYSLWVSMFVMSVCILMIRSEEKKHGINLDPK